MYKYICFFKQEGPEVKDFEKKRKNKTLEKQKEKNVLVLTDTLANTLRKIVQILTFQNIQGLGFPDLSGSTTNKKTNFLRLPLCIKLCRCRRRC